MHDGISTLCPVCEGEGVVLGTLGRRIHYRCRHCGIDFSEEVDETNTLRPVDDGDDGDEDA